MGLLLRLSVLDTIFTRILFHLEIPTCFALYIRI